MNKKAELNYVGLVVIAAICIIIGASLFASNIGNDIGTLTKKTSIVNETLSLAPVRLATSGSINATKYLNLANGCPFIIGNWRLSDISDCALSGVSITLLNGTALTATTDYVVNTTAGTSYTSCTANRGDIRFVNSSLLGLKALDTNDTVVSYTYCQDGYIPTSNAGARGIVPLIAVFFALLIMAIPLMIIFRNQLLEMVGIR